MYLVLRQKRTPILTFLLAINFAVYLCWFYYLIERDFGFMERHFTVSWQGLMAGRWHTLLTSAISHSLFFHLFLNMFVLKSFGGLMERVLGSAQFLLFYVAAGMFSSLSHCLASAFLIGNPALMAVGASGSISGIILLFALMFPRERIYFFGLIPIPALFGALAFIGLDIWGLVAQAKGGSLPIGHGAHLGGAMYGILYFFLHIRSRRLKRFKKDRNTIMVR